MFARPAVPARREAVIVVDTDGTSRHLVDAVSESIAEAIGPKVETRRSSHVETWANLSQKARLWLFEHRALIASVDDRLYELEDDGADLTNCFWADMLPVGGPILGPFEWHDHAIEAEIKYLHEHDLPCPI